MEVYLENSVYKEEEIGDSLGKMTGHFSELKRDMNP